jgi:glycosyltransferase involved in cell wall biosynthesis
MAHTWVPHTGAGAETASHALAVALVEAGHRVEVCLTAEYPVREDYVIDGVAVWRHEDTGTVFRWFGTDDNTPDVVVSYLHSVTRAAVLCDMHSIPLVHIAHNEHQFTGHAIRRGPADLVIYNTEYVRSSLESFLGNHDTALPPAEVVWPPIHRDRFTGPSTGKCVTHVNLAAVKNPDVFYHLARAFPEQPFLGVCGGYSAQHLQELPNVEIISHVRPDEMAEKVYSRTKVLLQPSRYESYGMVAVEAACMGVPTLASTAPGLMEALGDAGVFVDPDDLDGYTTALRRLLTPRGWAAASKRALRRAGQLTTDDDLARWVKAVESLARVRVAR